MHEEMDLSVGRRPGREGELVNSIPQALVVTGCHFKACAFIQESEKTASVFNCVIGFLHSGSFVFVFFAHTLSS